MKGYVGAGIVVLNTEGKTVTNGYKPQMAMDLLDIKRESLRYWKKHIDPNPNRSHFSSGVLLVYRIIKTYVRIKHIPVDVLEKCSWKSIFHMFESTPYKDFYGSLIVVNEREPNVFLSDSLGALDQNDIYLHALPLNPVLNEHIQGFTELGMPGYENVSAIDSARSCSRV